jgi:hypothetical protein
LPELKKLPYIIYKALFPVNVDNEKIPGQSYWQKIGTVFGYS